MVRTAASLSRWFPCLLAAASIAITLWFVVAAGSSTAALQAGLALLLGVVLLAVGYFRYATTDLPGTEAGRVAAWTAGGFGVFLVMNLWFRGLEFTVGAVAPQFAVLTSLTAGTLGGTLAGIGTARRHRDHASRTAALDDYRVIFEEVEDAIIVHDAATFAIRDANPKAVDLLGYRVEELREVDVMDITASHPERDSTQVEQKMTAALEGDGDRFEWPIERKDGTYRWLQVSLKRATLHDDDVVLAVLRDITDQKERRQDLEQYETLAETVRDGLYATDADGEFTYVNDAMCDLTGYDRAALVGMHFSTLLERDAVDRVVEARAEIRRNTATTTAIEFDLVRGDASTVPTETRFTALADDEGTTDEGFEGTVGVIRDISDRREYEVQLQTLHEVTRDLMAESDPEAIAQRSCAAFDDLLDHPVSGVFLEEGEELVAVATSRGAGELFDTVPVLPAGESLAWEVYETGEPQVHGRVSKAANVYDPDSPIDSEAIFPLGTNGVVIVGSPEPGAFSAQDVELMQVLAANTRTALDRARAEQSLRAREEELAERNERLDRFAELVAHDLRNPLTSAMGWLDLARESGDPAEFERVETAHERIREIITDLLELARSGGQVDRTDHVDLRRLATDVWTGIDTNGASLQVEESAMVAADASRLRQVFDNLLRNAVVHGDSDVTVHLGTLPDDEGFYVADDGPGIPPDERDQIFEPGYTTHEEGTGFGMVVVDQLVSAHGWDISVSEADEGGAAFEIHGVEFPAE
ncbi:PAS domain S-box protein [Haloglomus salinum]|jgi:PAS domain S-box-containing protein|uniref:PAS domain S-box protein n=1 Tax=Haloglomus salinum TaxID=2962673 RepID=UPI0020C9755D|nr:PAS domain S-box protein [Haloglomus salinum]